jgi:FkbM family methyltransferase
LLWSRLIFALYRRLTLIWPGNFFIYYPPAGRRVLMGRGIVSNLFEVFQARIYEPVIPLPEQPKIIDLGGFVGYAAIFFLQMRPRAHLRVVEANPATHALQSCQLGRTGLLSDRVELLNVAVTDSVGEIELRVDRVNPTNIATNAFHDMSRFPDAENFTTIKVPT